MGKKLLKLSLQIGSHVGQGLKKKPASEASGVWPGGEREKEKRWVHKFSQKLGSQRNSLVRKEFTKF